MLWEFRGERVKRILVTSLLLIYRLMKCTHAKCITETNYFLTQNINSNIEMIYQGVYKSS